MDKTVVVAIVDNVKHPLYKKIIKRTVKLKAHDEQQCLRHRRYVYRLWKPVLCPRTKDGELLTIIGKG